jgi:hypothetical protein
MNTPSAPQPERPPAGGTSGSADDDVPPAPGQSEPAIRPAAGHTGRPDPHEGSAQAGDGEDDDDEYEPL